jgi:hypothetical protein
MTRLYKLFEITKTSQAYRSGLPPACYLNDRCEL